MILHTLSKKSFLHVFFASICIIMLAQCNDHSNESAIDEQAKSLDLHDPSDYQYGYHTDSVYFEENTIERDQVMGDLLQQYDVPYQTIFSLAEKAKEIFDVRMLREGKKYAIARDNFSGEVISFIYEPSPYRYVEYSVRDSVDVKIHQREHEICQEEMSGVITSSLWASMIDQGHVYDLIVAMEDALAWSVSFQYVQPGDFYKLIVDRTYIDGVPVGIHNLSGAYFKSMDTEFYSIYYDNPYYAGYYDEIGLPMKKAFLKAPVQYSRISSGYSARRFHPVLKRFKGHFGTDFAAPCGTPIMAVADGVVTKAGYTGGNGNYVKIRHDNVYETQYLHMTKFAQGIKPGAHVKQTDVIGYVGRTGLATGCHVCFRFWRDKKQVDFFRQKLPPPEPMPEEALPEFLKIRDIIKKQLDEIQNPVIS